MKRNRKAISYRVRMWFYRLTREDFNKAFWFCMGWINAILLCVAIFIFLFIVPAFFH